MFKKFMTFVTVAAAALSLASCEKDPNGTQTTIEFEKTLYTVYDKGSVDVVLKASKTVAEELIIPISFSGGAEKGVDFDASAEAVTIAAGETSGAVTIKNLALTTDKQVSVSFSLPTGYAAGTKKIAVVSPDTQEALVYSFKAPKGYALEQFVAEIEVTGTTSGKDFKATEDIVVPLQLSGEGAAELQFVSENTEVKSIASTPSLYAIIPAGQSKATIKFNVQENYSGEADAILTVDTDNDSRFIEGGENETLTIAVRGLQTPDKLVGTWKFKEVYDIDELEAWFDEMEDDKELLPTKNDGFTLTFTKEDDGSVKVKPNGTGDFAKFFREATVTLSEPKNPTPSAFCQIGNYGYIDNNQFVTEANGYPYQYNTYYKLSVANRAFDTTESLGEAVVVFALIDEGLVVEFHDYDTPPFGEMWWDDDFDADMFGFASLFVKE